HLGIDAHRPKAERAQLADHFDGKEQDMADDLAFAHGHDFQPDVFVGLKLLDNARLVLLLEGARVEVEHRLAVLRPEGSDDCLFLVHDSLRPREMRAPRWTSSAPICPFRARCKRVRCPAASPQATSRSSSSTSPG